MVKCRLTQARPERDVGPPLRARVEAVPSDLGVFAISRQDAVRGGGRQGWRRKAGRYLAEHAAGQD